jgi:hypothetical protein
MSVKVTGEAEALICEAIGHDLCAWSGALPTSTGIDLPARLDYVPHWRDRANARGS